MDCEPLSNGPVIDYVEEGQQNGKIEGKKLALPPPSP